MTDPLQLAELRPDGGGLACCWGGYACRDSLLRPTGSISTDSERSRPSVRPAAVLHCASGIEESVLIAAVECGSRRSTSIPSSAAPRSKQSP